MKHVRNMIAISLLAIWVSSMAQDTAGGPLSLEVAGAPPSLVVAEAPADDWTVAKDLLDYTCKGKAIVASYAITNRDRLSEKEVLASLKKDWEESYRPAGVSFTTYVDMQRIVRDTMRKHRDGTWVRHWEDDDEIRNYMSNELVECFANKW